MKHKIPKRDAQRMFLKWMYLEHEHSFKTKSHLFKTKMRRKTFSLKVVNAVPQIDVEVQYLNINNCKQDKDYGVRLEKRC